MKRVLRLPNGPVARRKRQPPSDSTRCCPALQSLLHLAVHESSPPPRRGPQTTFRGLLSTAEGQPKHVHRAHSPAMEIGPWLERRHLRTPRLRRTAQQGQKGTETTVLRARHHLASDTPAPQSRESP